MGFYTGRPSWIKDSDIDPSWTPLSESELRFAQFWVMLHPKLDLHTELTFAHPRRFRFDFAHVPSKVAIEIQGEGPGHDSRAGIRRDQEKLREAAARGWVVCQVASDQVEDEAVIGSIVQTIRIRRGER